MSSCLLPQCNAPGYTFEVPKKRVCFNGRACSEIEMGEVGWDHVHTCAVHILVMKGS